MAWVWGFCAFVVSVIAIIERRRADRTQARLEQEIIKKKRAEERITFYARRDTTDWPCA